MKTRIKIKHYTPDTSDQLTYQTFADMQLLKLDRMAQQYKRQSTKQVAIKKASKA